MITRALSLLATLIALAVLVGNSSAGPTDIAVQARGPVHEGYAQPFDAVPQPGAVVPKAPPDPIPELPPDQKPEGDNVQWIPGYWNWDSDKSDYVWVSGFWRAAPPQRKWVAGYWQKAEDGWQWVSGYWSPQSQDQPQLMDPPPEPPEAGPTIPAPDDNSMYVPGSWMWRNERYLWRPGFWSPERSGWVWVPAHYVWTPGGYVFVDGYWDYPLETRGILFAPVVFERPLWQTPGWCFTPSYVVDIDPSFFSCLFIGPRGNDYCFGDYYDPGYLRAGYRPWCDYGRRRYDPLYGYYRWSHRDNPGWLRGVNSTYAGRRDGTLDRPARTLHQQTAAVRRGGSGSAVRAVQPLSDFRGLKLASIDRTQVARHQAAAQRIVESSRQRVQYERPSNRGRPSGTRSMGSGAPVIVNRSAADHPAQHHVESHNRAPEVVHSAPHSAAAPAHRAAPAAVPQHHDNPPAHHAEHAPVHQPAAANHHSAPAPRSAPPAHHANPAPAHHANPAPTHHAAPTHASPPARSAHSAPAHIGPSHAKPSHSGGGGGGHKKK